MCFGCFPQPGRKCRELGNESWLELNMFQSALGPAPRRVLLAPSAASAAGVLTQRACCARICLHANTCILCCVRLFLPCTSIKASAWHVCASVCVLACGRARVSLGRPVCQSVYARKRGCRCAAACAAVGRHLVVAVSACLVMVANGWLIAAVRVSACMCVQV